MQTKYALENFDEIREALELIKAANFTEEQLRAQERKDDNRRAIERKILESKLKGYAEGEAKGESTGKSDGIKEGSKITISIIRDLKDPSTCIAEKYGVSVEFVREVQAVLGLTS
ncbi:MAG: hypothetical protein ACK5AO_05060 [bacterium]|jgi:flagellar biosynthesis/type III secretory pathway protein FliH